MKKSINLPCEPGTCNHRSPFQTAEENPNVQPANGTTFNQPSNFPTGYLGSLPGPDDIKRVELPNGIVVLARANFNSPSVVINGYLPAGALFDPDEKLGLADFTASALMRGTERYDFQAIYDQLEAVGASLGTNGGTHSTSFGGRALAEDIDLVLSLLAEILRRPTFPNDPVERLRAQLLTGLAIRAQDTGDMASLTLDGIIYPEHPYRRPDDGYPETVSAITQRDLAEFQKKHYGPRGIVIAVVGALDPGEAAEKVAEVLGDWENPGQPLPPELPPLHPLEKTLRAQVAIPGKSQADIMIGAPGPARRSPDYLPAALGNSVIGQFGMMGRIGEAVREKAGLAYYASSSLGGGSGPGPWSFSAGVDPGNVDQAVGLILQEITRFVNEPVDQEELSDSQAQFIGSLPLSLESNGGVAARLVNLERYDLGLDYYRRYPDLVRGITVEQVMESARGYLDPDRIGIAVAGP